MTKYFFKPVNIIGDVKNQTRVLKNNIEIHTFYEIGLAILIKVISAKGTKKHVHQQFYINDKFAKIILRPLSRYIVNANEDDMQTLYSLFVVDDNNINNHGSADIKHLYTFFSTLWQQKYINDRKEEYVNEISNELTKLLLDHLKNRLKVMANINRKLAFLLQTEVLLNENKG